ncbi:hypothetical protein [Texcoconibacillus texcoconensis]|uniref:Uncharacterized protein n=1 Tax=Texcoconibacillus texcoconensis TaxID=1095777 RepID=A0A840QU96_9BACI|nr:hypothetical protein [Texcoconibacillus texcoconensis]MBB5174944.1 hypothetical protein [Texcoconibacillus texcoconensis]
MMGVLFQDKELEEVKHLLNRELEELLLDLSDSRIDGIVKRAMEERYQLIFKMYKRFASHEEVMKYVRGRKNVKIDKHQ